MNLSETIKLLINITTMITIAIVIIISFYLFRRRKVLNEKAGVSVKTYLWIVGIVEVIYDVGIILILYAMGVNVLQHLKHLEFGKFFSAIDSVDISKMKYVGTIGWIGFSMNCAVTYIAPVYLLIKGGKKLPPLIYSAAWTEIGLETVVRTLVFISLFLG